MGSFIKFDEFLIANYFEPLAWMFETKFGPRRDNFLLARLINVAFWVWAIVDPIRTHWELTGVFSQMSLMFAFLGVLVDLRIKERAQAVRAKPVLLNPFKKQYWVRFSIIVLGLAMSSMPSTFGPLDILQALLAKLLLILGVYFFACNPLPPGWVYGRKRTQNFQPAEQQSR